MKKGKLIGKVFGIAIVFVMIAGVLGGFSALTGEVEASPATIYVPDNYPTIQAAVDAASPGDTIIVRDGTYIENVNVNKDHLTIKSQNGAEKTIVQAAQSSVDVFHVSTRYAEISGFTVKGATGYGKAGLAICGFDVVRDNVILNNYYGIRGGYFTNDYVLLHNAIFNNTDGIRILYSSNGVLSGNNVSENSQYGIYLDCCKNSSLRDNLISDNQYDFRVEGSSLDEFVLDIDTSNKINGKPIQYLVAKTDLVIDTTWDIGYLGIINCENVVVRNLSLANRYDGILLAYSDNCRIENVELLCNFNGIHMHSCSGNTLIGNAAKNNRVNGILLKYCSYNNLLANTLTNNTLGFQYPNGYAPASGIYLIKSNFNTLQDNTFLDNHAGIATYVSNNNTLVNNSLSSNRVGIDLFGSSNNIAKNNTISASWCAIGLSGAANNTLNYNTILNCELGMDIYSSSGWNSSQNTIYLNNFETNIRNIYDNGSVPSINTWHSPEEITYTYHGNSNTNYLGNYWSDYTGSDADGDGIGDTLYPVDSDTDSYPLMEPWENYGIGETPPENQPPTTSALSLTGQPKIMYPNTTYTVTAAYHDPDGMEGLKYCYLRLNHPTKPLTLMWNQATDDYSAWAGEEGTNYITVTGYTVPMPDSGYDLNWQFTINNAWPEVENAIDFGVFATDDQDAVSGWDYDDSNASFSKGLMLISPLIISPPGSHYVGDCLSATFTVKNNADFPITLTALTVGGRDPLGIVTDFEWTENITLISNEEYVYTGRLVLPYVAGVYHFFCAYQVDDRWNTCIDLGEGLIDESRIEDIDVIGIDYLLGYPYEGRGGIILPVEEFPEGQGQVIPIYVPEVVNGSNALTDDDDWTIIYQDEQKVTDWSWLALFANLACARPTKEVVIDPISGEPAFVYSPQGSAFSLAAGIIRAAAAAQSVMSYRITVQRDPQSRLRATIEIGDPENTSFLRNLAGKGPTDVTLYAKFYQAPFSDALEKAFHLEPDNYPIRYYTLFVQSDASHGDDEYVEYLSMSDDNEIVITPKLYPQDYIRVGMWINWFWPKTIYEFAGDQMVSLLESSVDDEQSKDLLKLITPAYIVPESATISTVFSPVELRVYDSNGYVTGMVNGMSLEEIPNSICIDHTIVILTPEDTYRYDVIGMQEGFYGLKIISIRDRIITEFNALQIDTSLNCLHQYTIDWDSLSQGEEGVTVHVDSDGDGTFERTFTSDGELTRDEFIPRSGCFIATAAYGTPMAEEIQILREFRDEYLLTNPAGQALVDLYYKVSPPIAEFITDHPSLKPTVRTSLVPAVAMGTIAVNTTPAEKMAIVGFLVLVSVAVAVWATRRRGRRDSSYSV